MIDKLQCPDCGFVTPNPDDVREKYCPRCHWWTSDPELGEARRRERPAAIEQAHAWRAWHDCKRLQPRVALALTSFGDDRCDCPEGACRLYQPPSSPPVSPPTSPPPDTDGQDASS